MAAGALKGEHYAGQLLVRNFLAAALMAYLVILAKQAKKIAMGKKYCTGTFSACERSLFSKMGVIT